MQERTSQLGHSFCQCFSTLFFLTDCPQALQVKNTIEVSTWVGGEQAWFQTHGGLFEFYINCAETKIYCSDVSSVFRVFRTFSKMLSNWFVISTSCPSSLSSSSCSAPSSSSSSGIVSILSSACSFSAASSTSFLVWLSDELLLSSS